MLNVSKTFYIVSEIQWKVFVLKHNLTCVRNVLFKNILTY